MKIPHKFRSFDGTRIAYRVWGEPTELPPVFFCSGIACDDVYWRDLAPEIAEDRVVLTWDYPWHGDSGPPGDRREITVAALARHAHTIYEREELRPSVFIGHSMGVQVLFEYYRLFPEEVAGIVTIAGGFSRTVGYLYGTNVGELILSGLRAAVRLQPDWASLVWRTLMNPSVADPVGRAGGLIGPAPEPVMRHYFEHLQKIDPAGLFDMFKQGHTHSAEDVLGHIKVPVLILHGTADVMTPFSVAKVMSEKIPTATLQGFEGGAHTLPAEDPEAIARAVRGFLAAEIDPDRTGRAGSRKGPGGRTA